MGRKRKCQVLSVETDYHIVEIEEPAYKELLKFCDQNDISIDYFFFEFQEFAK
jgi:hypothetical protein